MCTIHISLTFLDIVKEAVLAERVYKHALSIDPGDGAGTHVLQGVAGCCRVLQCVAVCCSVLQCVVVWCSWQSACIS